MKHKDIVIIVGGAMIGALEALDISQVEGELHPLEPLPERKVCVNTLYLDPDERYPKRERVKDWEQRRKQRPRRKRR